MIEAFRFGALARPLAWRRAKLPLVVDAVLGWLALLAVLVLLGQAPIPRLGAIYVAGLFAVGLVIDAPSALVTLFGAGLAFGLGFGRPGFDLLAPTIYLAAYAVSALFLVGRISLPDQPLPIRIGLVAFDFVTEPLRAALSLQFALGLRSEFRARLDAEVRRRRLRRERPHWRNWGHTAECRPAVAFFPETLADIQDIVAECSGTGRRMRVVAQGHSWPALSTTDDILVVTHRLDKVSVDLTHPTRPLLVAESGATNWAINDALESAGLTLPFNVVLESVRIGGLIATGSHGSGWNTPTLSDLVETIEIVDARGELVIYSEATHGAEVMSAVRLNLGLFGIVYRVHLRVEPDYRVHQTDRDVPIAVMLDEIADLAPAHEALDLYYWPYQKVVTLRVWDRVDAPSVAKTRKTPRRVYGDAGFAWFHAAEQWVMRTWPRTVPAIAAFNYPFFPRHDRVTDVREAIHWRDAIELLRVSCVEFAFKLDPDFATFKQAWRDAMEVIEDYERRGLYPFNMTINARFIGSSDCLLAPAAGAGHTCYIEILSSSPTPQWEAFTSQIALRWMKLPGARPHWAKEWEFIPGIEAFLRDAYGDRLHRFLAIRDALGVDPNLMFSNALMDRVIFAAQKDAARERQAADVDDARVS